MAKVGLSSDQPLVVTPDLLIRISTISAQFREQARKDLLISRKLSPADYRTSQDLLHAAETIHDAERYRLERVADEMESLEREKWEIVFSDGLSTEIPFEDIQHLPNIGPERIVRISMNLGGYLKDHRLSITFAKSGMFTNTFECLIESTPTIARAARDALKTQILAARESWWLAREPKFMIPVSFGLVLILSVGPAIAIVSNGLSPISRNDIPWFGALLLTSFILGGFLGGSVTKVWDWLFPRVLYKIGAGVNDYSMRSKVRTALFWTVPVFGIGLPVIVNIATK